MNPYTLSALLVAILAAGAGGFKLGVDHEIASQKREDQHIAQAVDAATNAAAEAIGKIKVTNSKIINEVQHEITKEVVYRDCVHTPNGLQLINQAITGRTNAASESKLP